MCIDVCAHIALHNLLGLYVVYCMHAFKAGPLGLDNYLVCSSLGEIISLARSIPQLPRGLFLIYFSKSVGFVPVQLLFRQSYW